MPHPYVYVATGVAIVAAAIYAYFSSGGYPPHGSSNKPNARRTDGFEFISTTAMCTICLDSCRNHETYLNCGHIFHKNCIQKWFVTSKTCPNCKSPAQIL